IRRHRHRQPRRLLGGHRGRLLVRLGRIRRLRRRRHRRRLVALGLGRGRRLRRLRRVVLRHLRLLGLRRLLLLGGRLLIFFAALVAEDDVATDERDQRHARVERHGRALARRLARLRIGRRRRRRTIFLLVGRLDLVVVGLLGLAVLRL